MATALLFLGGGCTNAKLAYAPRMPGPSRPPKNESAVTMVDLGKPRCSYEVIGTVFGTSLEELKTAAAENGGDGVYDTQCLQSTMEFSNLEYAKLQCDGRVYVCTGGQR